MTAIREQAIEMVKRIPEDKVYYLVNILKNIEEMTSSNNYEQSESWKAYQELQKYRKCGTLDIDDKEEIHSAWEKKYESLN